MYGGRIRGIGLRFPGAVDMQSLLQRFHEVTTSNIRPLLTASANGYCEKAVPRILGPDTPCQRAAHLLIGALVFPQ